MNSLQLGFKNLARSIRCALPNTCIVCGLTSSEEYAICSECREELPSLGECCVACGIEINGTIAEGGLCAKCLRKPPSFNCCHATFPYVSPINKLITKFKFSARFDIGYTLSRLLAEKFEAHYPRACKPRLLLPVPLHRKRLRARGFNQAHEICKVLTRHCKVKTSNTIIIKNRNTATQTAMSSAAARKSNLRGAFKLGDLRPLKDVTHIALIDDVVTTMATAEAISKLLQSHKALRIDVWCLARASR